MIGQKISHYQILEELGSGGMGLVYKAKDLKLDRFVAIKFLNKELHSDSESRQRFINEAKTISSLDHPNIAVVHEIDEFDDRIFISMGFYEGATLQQLLAEGPLPMEEIYSIAIQIANGLAEAHRSGVVHRDIKPGNIIVTKNGQVKILDFGLSKGVNLTLITREDTILGTAAYMSPEQIQGQQLDHRSDLFSFGILLYEMIAGERPFAGEFSAAVTYSIINDDPPSLSKKRPEVAEKLERIVLKALSKDEDKRYQSASEIVAELEALRAGRASERSRRATGKGRRPVRPLAFLIGAVLAVALMAFLVFRSDRPSSPQSTAQKTAIVVMPFEFIGDDPASNWLGKAMTELINASLGQSQFLRVVDTEQRSRIARSLGLSEDNFSTEQHIRIARESDSQKIIQGQVRKTGTSLAIQAEVVDTAEPTSTIQLETIQSDNLNEATDQLTALLNDVLAIDGTLSAGTADLTTRSLDAFRYFIEGQEAALDRRHQESIDKLRKAISFDSTYVQAYYWLAFQYDEIGESEKAGQFLAQIKPYISNLSQKERLEYLKEEAKNENRYGDYITYLEEILKIDPSEAYAHYSYGWTLYRKFRKIDQGILEMKKALELDPTYTIAYNTLGYAYLARGDKEQALRMVEKYIGLNPTGLDPLDSKAEILLYVGQYEEALALCERILSLKPDFLSTHLIMVRVYIAQGKFSRALEALNQYMKVAKNLKSLSKGQILKTKIFSLQENYSDALGAIDEAISMDRDNPDSHWMRGRILLHLQRNSDFEKQLNALELTLADVGGLDQRWLLYHLQGEAALEQQAYEQASEMLQKALGLGIPNRSFYLTALGNVYAQSGQAQKAVVEYRDALAFNPNYVLALFRLAETYEKLGQDQDAREAYERVAQIWSDADAGLKQLNIAKAKTRHL
ncbi:MAG: protein kinase [bacterium]